MNEDLYLYRIFVVRKSDQDKLCSLFTLLVLLFKNFSEDRQGHPKNKIDYSLVFYSILFYIQNDKDWFIFPFLFFPITKPVPT